MSSSEMYDLGLTDPDGSERIDMSDEDVRKSRLVINLKMANLGMEPKDRAKILDILGLAEPSEFKPEFRPEPPLRLCRKKLHNIGDPANYRIRKNVSLFGDERVCLACEDKIKQDRSERINGRRS